MGQFFSTNAAVNGNPKHAYGWKCGRPDHRDLWHEFGPLHESSGTIDLRKNCPEVYDQGNLGSCTANAIAACYEYALCQQGLHDFHPSRLFIYYNEREMEGHVGEDSGAEIRDGMKSIHSMGVCPEPQWPYNITKFTQKPDLNCYETALGDRSIKYNRVRQTKDQLLTALNIGFPVAFGFTVYESFETSEVATTGVMPVPAPRERILGGHAVVIVGYQPATDHWVVRNSWGAGWGDQGYFYMPGVFLLDPAQCSDFWTVTRVEACEI